VAGDPTRPDTFLSGLRVIAGRYHVEQVLGRGGMGIVVLAEHMGLKRRCAVKLLRPEQVRDDAALARFRSEAEALARLEHANVVRVMDSGVDAAAGGVPYLVMEYLPGPTLRRVLVDEGRLAVDRALPIMAQIADALDVAHRRGVVHGDLKPENVILADEGGPVAVPKVLDLGLARFVAREPGGQRSGGRTGERVHAAEPARGDHGTETSGGEEEGWAGTVGYVAPEVLAGAPPAPPSDIYAFAVLAFEVLFGERPQAGVSPDRAIGGAAASPATPCAPGDGLAAQLAAALEPALSVAPEGRPASAGVVVRQLLQVWHRHRLAAWRRREGPRRALLAVAVAAVSLMLGGWLAGSPPLRSLDRRVQDLGIASAAPRAPDRRILLISIDDASLEADPTPLADLGDRLGRELARVMEAGAVTVGIDLLLPEQWGRDPGFVDLVLEHHEQLTLAAYSSDGRVVGPEAVQGLITVGLGAEGASALFALANVTADADGVVRRCAAAHVGTDGRSRPGFAARVAAPVAPAAGAAGPALLDSRADTGLLERISFASLGRELDLRPERFSGRLVLVGLEIAGSGEDVHRVPAPGGVRTVSGLALQALMVHGAICDDPLQLAPLVLTVAAAGIATLVASWVLLWSASPRLRVTAPMVAAGSLVGYAWILHAGRGWLVPLAGPLAALVLSTALSLAVLVRLTPRPARSEAVDVALEGQA
jgi:CHASE2 domain-containing sensor protein/tRNA A-37 threonylcarbamoyl transferase component Bud32